MATPHKSGKQHARDSKQRRAARRLKAQLKRESPRQPVIVEALAHDGSFDRPEFVRRAASMRRALQRRRPRLAGSRMQASCHSRPAARPSQAQEREALAVRSPSWLRRRTAPKLLAWCHPVRISLRDERTPENLQIV